MNDDREQRQVPGYSGRCHCGAIGFTYHSTTKPESWQLRACQCRFCRCHDALSASSPGAEIAFHASDAEQLQRYRFGLRTADFLLCRECGVYIGAVIATERGQFGIINTHALDPQPAGLAAAVPADYDGEVVADRVNRREQRWAPVTALPW